MSCYYICAVHYHVNVISTRANAYLPFKSLVAKPVIEIDGKLIEFGVSPVNLTCKSASDEDVLGKYDWRRNNVIE